MTLDYTKDINALNQRIDQMERNQHGLLRAITRLTNAVRGQTEAGEPTIMAREVNAVRRELLTLELPGPVEATDEEQG